MWAQSLGPGQVRPVRLRISIRFIRRWVREAGGFLSDLSDEGPCQAEAPLRQWGSFLATLFALVIVPPSAGPLEGGGPGVLWMSTRLPPHPIEGYSSTVVPSPQRGCTSVLLCNATTTTVAECPRGPPVGSPQLKENIFFLWGCGGNPVKCGPRIRLAQLQINLRIVSL